MDELIRKLQERRAALHASASEILARAESRENLTNTPEEITSYDALVKDIEDVNGQIERREAQAKRESLAAPANAGNGHVAHEARAVITSEPTTYGPGTGHSYFLDMARDQLNRGDGDQGVGAARDRLKRHTTEVDRQMPERRAAVERRSAKAFEDAFAANPRERRALSRMEKMGVSPFEKRFISRTDGQGGYFVPPLWLIDDYIPYLRAGRVFADQWRRFPLPAGTDSINIPRLVLGTATGPQTADGGPVPGRDATDNFVNALVRTVAGQQDAAIQLLDQSPVAFDQIIFGDLMADLAMQLSGQLIVGSGVNGQLLGLYPTGSLGTSSGFSTSIGYVLNDAGAAWTAASGTANFYAGLAKVISNLARNRMRPITGIVTNPAVWYGMASAMDTTLRPLVIPQQQGNNFNQAAGDDDGPVTEGPVGHVLGVPWIVDPNIPLTFGGTGATQPSIGVISNGNTAPVPGSGGSAGNSNVFTPAVAAVWDDLYLWEGELRSRTLSEVLSGTLQVRFQVYMYAADMPNRFQNSSNQLLSYGNYNNIGTQATVLSTGTGGLLVGF